MWMLFGWNYLWIYSSGSGVSTARTSRRPIVIHCYYFLSTHEFINNFFFVYPGFYSSLSQWLYSHKFPFHRSEPGSIQIALTWIQSTSVESITAVPMLSSAGWWNWDSFQPERFEPAFKWRQLVVVCLAMPCRTCLNITSTPIDRITQIKAHQLDEIHLTKVSLFITAQPTSTIRL